MSIVLIIHVPDDEDFARQIRADLTHIEIQTALASSDSLSPDAVDPILSDTRHLLIVSSMAAVNDDNLHALVNAALPFAQSNSISVGFLDYEPADVPPFWLKQAVIDFKRGYHTGFEQMMAHLRREDPALGAAIDAMPPLDPALPVNVQLALQSDVSFTRRGAVAELRNYLDLPASEEAARQLLEQVATHDPDPTIQDEARQALGQTKPPLPAARPAKRRIWLIAVPIVIVVLGGIAAAVLLISASQRRAQEATQTAIAEAGLATNTAQMQAANATSAARTTATAQQQATIDMAQTLTQEVTFAARTAVAESRATMISGRATGTQSVRDSYVDLIESTQNGTPTYGPVSGSLTRTDDDFLQVQFAGYYVENFVLEVTFVNPYSADFGHFDYGVLFRHVGSNAQLRLFVESDGEWGVVNVDGRDNFTRLRSGTTEHLRQEDNDSNTIRLLVRDDLGVFFLNGEFISEIDLSSRTGTGNVAVSVDMVNSNFFEAGTTSFIDFTVWKLP